MPKIIRDLDDRDRLPEIVKRFAALDVHPDRVSNAEMARETHPGRVRTHHETNRYTGGINPEVNQTFSRPGIDRRHAC